MTTIAKQLLAAGIPITLVDGQEVRLRYGMRGLAALEEEFGTVTAALATVNHDGGEKPLFGPLARVLRHGLYDTDLSDDEALDLLDVPRLSEYLDAVNAAFEEAFPGDDDAAAGRGNDRQPTGRGRTGTTSRPSRSAAATASSG